MEKDSVKILQSTVEQIGELQKSVSAEIAVLNEMSVNKSAVLGDYAVSRMSEDDKLKAAYVLNLCMVSISQIVDYDDVNILEQEYETVLNCLNLEQMPKDEALLAIFKQILDTVTFFRIQEGDKKMLDLEYQHKMKNAIWSAIPNLSVIHVSGPGKEIDARYALDVAISLASQIGIGYMNYRRTKAENALDATKQEWQLRRTAIEQFNGLRRELFDTSWRIADAYNFPDEYRLTERQIRQYNDILMDNDLLRKYERLDTIKDKFMAYPPFWYFLGNTANLISQDESWSSETRGKYRSLAKEHFETYRRANRFDVLREDQLSASCALEYIDLLDSVKDREKILELVGEAVNKSGETDEVLQLCAIAYLKVGDAERAAILLRRLVNNDFNKIANAQLLSRIYVAMYREKHTDDVRIDYETLGSRVGMKSLYPMPSGIGEKDDSEELEAEFMEQQKADLRRIFGQVIIGFREKYMIQYNRIIPYPGENEMPDDFYSEKNKESRISKMGKYIGRENQLWIKDISGEFTEILNEIIQCLRLLDWMLDDGDIFLLADDIKGKIIKNRDDFQLIQKRATDRSFGKDDYVKFEELFDAVTREFFSDIVTEAVDAIKDINSMDLLSQAEESIREFCMKSCIQMPAVNYEVSPLNNSPVLDGFFKVDFFGEYAVESQSLENKKEKILEKIKGEGSKLIISGNESKSKLLISGSIAFRKYFSSKANKDYSDFMPNTLAVLADGRKEKNHIDLFFTSEGIIARKAAIFGWGNAHDIKLAPYKEIGWGDNGALDIGGYAYSNPDVDSDALLVMCDIISRL